jgi:hypothetical protein
MKFRAGDWIVVKSQDDILSSLDRSGELGALPLMAEMLQYCGQRLQVSAVAHKTCDTMNKSGGRRVENAVHLKGIRCNGSAHGGCQAGCLIFWKMDWLKASTGSADRERESPLRSSITVEDLRAAGVRNEGGEPVYSCQATRLFAATSPLPWWDLRQYAKDFWSGNVSVRRFMRVVVLRAF